MTVDDIAKELQGKIEKKFTGIGKGKYARIIRMARKPGRDEYLKVLMITGAGIALLGVMGFVIYLVLGVYFKIP